MILSPYYDAGEMSAAGLGEPMYFLDRPRISLACGALAAGLVLLTWSAYSRSGVNRAALWRAVVYGLMPLGFMYAFHAAWIGISETLPHFGRVPMQWWYGVRTPTGRTAGGAVWFGRLLNGASVYSVAWWWWHAAAAIVPRAPQWARFISLSVALITAALLFLRFLVYWGRLDLL